MAKQKNTVLTEKDMKVAIEWARSDSVSMNEVSQKLGVYGSPSQYIRLARLLKAAVQKGMLVAK